MSPLPIVPTVDFGRDICGDIEACEAREWLVTNGLGGYASGTIAGSVTRRYHGMLVAARQPPVGRTLLVLKLDETATCGTTQCELSTNRWRGGAIDPLGFRSLERFHLAGTMPVWTFAIADALVQKRVWMETGRNITLVEYRLVRGTRPVQLAVRTFVNERDFHTTTGAADRPMSVAVHGRKVKVSASDAVPIWLVADRGTVEIKALWYHDFWLAREAERGLESTEDHFLAAQFDVELNVSQPCVTFAMSAEDVAPEIDPHSCERYSQRAGDLLQNARAVMATHQSLPGWIEQLVLAADMFVVRRPLADDPGALSIIAGYHWFGDWGRDTMIALPGIALMTGRAAVAANILRTFARFVDGGMLPNYFPDAGDAPEYNTVDAALWFIEAVRSYDEMTADAALVRDLYPTLVAIVDAYERGTRYHIHVDAADGLVFAGEPGVQLTWMDAKVGDWVVTPRIGKAVEINALWYNALRALERFAQRRPFAQADAERFAQLAGRVETSFDRFWNFEQNCCYDVLDGPQGNDAAFRPNQLFAAALAYSPLSLARRRAIVAACGARLVTSYGLRSLDPSDPHFRGTYRGTVIQRDGAYHQGTVWGWLIGPWVAALLQCGVEPAIARSYLEPFEHHLQHSGLGSLAEIADGDAPFAPNGCIAQAWTVAAVLTAWHVTTVRDADGP